MATKTFDQWATDLYSAEIAGHIYNNEQQDGLPVEIPVGFEIPETLDQKIMRLVTAYQRDTGAEVETLDEANDFAIPGEDEGYDEDDYIIQQAIDKRKQTLSDSGTELDKAAPTPATPEPTTEQNGES